ncbi:MAG: hypothetical protein K2X91_13920 [Thermoleophilia bacterium]|nr:hypothetical protein [Thermoleophilia bacterium]
MSFIDEFRHEPQLLLASLEAAVGPLPAVEVRMPELLDREPTYADAWISAGDVRHQANQSPNDHLERARAELALYVELTRVERVDQPNVPLEDVHVTSTPEGITVTGRIPAGYVDIIGAPVHVSVVGDRCGDVDPDEGACILDAGHPGSHFHSMGRVEPRS